MSELCKLHEHKIDDLCHEVYGNGKPGLRDTIKNVDAKVNLLAARMETGVSILKWIFGFVAPAMMSVLVYFVIRILER